MLSIGDFTSILSHTKKLNGKIFACSSNQNGLRPFMDNNGLVDVGFNGWKFTWTNNRHGLVYIRERVDRGVANHLLTLSPNVILHHLLISSFDHAPILKDTMGRKNFSNLLNLKNFGFETLQAILSRQVHLWRKIHITREYSRQYKLLEYYGCNQLDEVA